MMHEHFHHFLDQTFYPAIQTLPRDWPQDGRVSEDVINQCALGRFFAFKIRREYPGGRVDAWDMDPAYCLCRRPWGLTGLTVLLVGDVRQVLLPSTKSSSNGGGFNQEIRCRFNQLNSVEVFGLHLATFASFQMWHHLQEGHGGPMSHSFDFSSQLIIITYTSSTAQGGCGSFKNRRPIGRVGCCDSRMAERIH